MISSPGKKCDSPLKKLRKLFRTNSRGSYELEPDTYFNYYNDDDDDHKIFSPVSLLMAITLLLTLYQRKSRDQNYFVLDDRLLKSGYYKSRLHEVPRLFELSNQTATVRPWSHV